MTRNWNNIMSNNQYIYRKQAEPFFNIVMEGLSGEVDGENFWEVMAEDVIFDFIYDIPGFTNQIKGRDAYYEWFKSYSMELHSADDLNIYKTENGNIIILEYAVHGINPSTGKAYNNKFCSIITIKNRKVVYWRDYMDTLAVMRTQH